MKFIKKYGICLSIGAIAGLINGLLGAGGGIIITYYLAHSLSESQKKENGVFANAVATMLPISIISIFGYLSKGYVTLNKDLLSILPSAFAGGILGAFLLSKLKLKTVKTVFAILVTFSGFLMIIK